MIPTKKFLGVPVIDGAALLNKIPRPERSGWIAVMMMLGSVYAVLHPPVPLESFCQLLPWGCPAQVVEVSEQQKRQATPLFFMEQTGYGPSDNDICSFEERLLSPKGDQWVFGPYMFIKRKDIGSINSPFPRQAEIWVVQNFSGDWEWQMRWHCPPINKKIISDSQKGTP